MKKRVLVPLAPKFEELEAVAVIDILRRAGAHVVTASVDATNPIVGRNRLRLMADLDISEALAEWGSEWDLVVLPGGPGVATLEENEALMALLGARIAEGGLVAAICAAPRVLLKAGLDPATPMTNFPGCRAELDACTAYSEASVVAGPKVITSRGAGTSIAFALACVEALYGEADAARVATEIVADAS